MGNIALKENAELNLDMEAMTEETEGHCDEWNTRYKQLLENEKYFEEKRKEYDQELEKIKLLRASFEAYGMVKVTDSAAVTDSTGLALAATEKNALIPGTLGNKLAQLNTDLIFQWNNFNVYPVDAYGEKWSENSGNTIYLCIHKITKKPWIVGSFIHNSNAAPIWNEVVLSFQSCEANHILQDCKPILAYGTGGRVYAGMVLSYNSIISKYQILCYPENVALRYMVIQGEVIRINSF